MTTIDQTKSYRVMGIRIMPLKSYINNKPVFFLAKRIFDIVMSTVVIVFLLSWFIPLLGILIKLNSNGPIFFVQRRVGRGLKSFGCIKFRTMYLNGEEDASKSDENDNRVTSIGRFLRITSLDELPQFINVLIGDMSIVGPRPHMFSDCNKFSGYIHDYKFRSIVRPGITGLAQVNGFRGPAEDSYNVTSRFYYDALYIRHMDARLDTKIIFNTALQVLSIIFFKKNAEGRNYKRVKTKAKKIAA